MRYGVIAALAASTAVMSASAAMAAGGHGAEALDLLPVRADGLQTPSVCGLNAFDTQVEGACEGIPLIAEGAQEDSVSAEDYGYQLPEGYSGGLSLVNVDLSDFAKWQICGINAFSVSEGQVCDNSIQAEGSESESGAGGFAVASLDTKDALHWSVCGIGVAGQSTTSC